MLRFTQINGTTWRVDEYYQGNITGIGFKWAQGSQVRERRRGQQMAQLMWTATSIFGTLRVREYVRQGEEDIPSASLE